MTTSWTAERRFLGTAATYARYRIPYPPELIALVAEACGLDHRARLLDLGCGPGILALAFAPLVGEALGLDPEPTMLEAARMAAGEAGLAVEFRAGRAPDDLMPAFGRFGLVTIGRAFHWMDRSATLQALEALVEPEGAVALFFDDHVRAAENAWLEAFKAVRAEFGQVAPVLAANRQPDWITHEQILLDSAFSDLTGFNRIARRNLTLDDLVSRAFSMSGTSPEALGERRDAFEAEMKRRVDAANGGRPLSEIVEAYALVARRPR